VGFAEVFLEFGIKRDVAGVIEKQVKLDFVITRPGEQCRIKRIGFRGDARHIGYAVGVLPFR
jgi:hypothetical protein